MLQVIGAGFGRTGTHSLGIALKMLGFGPTYNILEVSKNVAHMQMWQDALDDKPVDWHTLFANYRSAVEWPTITFLPQIVSHFSQAKIILTTRDPDSWFESANTTIFEGLELSAQNPDPNKRQQSAMKRRLILEHTFANRYREKAYAQDVMRQHNEQVMALVPPKRLLVYKVTEGWEPLCDFLGKPIPTEPFPYTNKRAEFQNSAPDWAKKLREEKKR
jgi:hypothetical protein